MRLKQFTSLWYVYRKPCTYIALTLRVSPNGKKSDSKLPTSSRSSIGCVQNDLRAYGTFDANRAPILPQVEHYLQTDRNEFPLEPRHLVVPLGASKMISKPVVCLARNMPLSCTDTNIVSKRKDARLQMTHVT